MANYYYLVAGLPDLIRSGTAKGLTYSTIVSEIEEELTAEDKLSLKQLRYRYDCENIASILNGSDDFSNYGNFSKDVLLNEFNSPEILPEFITSFLEERKEGSSVETSIIGSLLKRYSDWVNSTDNLFLKEWIEFELDLSNIISAKTASVLDFSIDDSIVNINEVSDKITRNSSSDFGLSSQIPWLDSIISNFEKPLELENGIDAIKWNKLDQLSDGNFFSINTVLSFVVKLNTIDRWLSLDDDLGNKKLDELLSNMSSAVALTA